MMCIARTREPDSTASLTASGRCSGFTLIELVIVIVVIAVLAGIAVPVYNAQIWRSKEAVLKHNLAVIRERIDQYRADKDRYPESIDMLIEEGYLRELPQDPITQSAEWEEIYSDFDPDQPDAEPGVFDVKSLSQQVATDGRPYNEW